MIHRYRETNYRKIECDWKMIVTLIGVPILFATQTTRFDECNLCIKRVNI